MEISSILDSKCCKCGAQATYMSGGDCKFFCLDHYPGDEWYNMLRRWFMRLTHLIQFIHKLIPYYNWLCELRSDWRYHKAKHDIQLAIWEQYRKGERPIFSYKYPTIENKLHFTIKGEFKRLLTDLSSWYDLHTAAYKAQVETLKLLERHNNVIQGSSKVLR